MAIDVVDLTKRYDYLVKELDICKNIERASNTFNKSIVSYLDKLEDIAIKNEDCIKINLHLSNREDTIKALVRLFENNFKELEDYIYKIFKEFDKLEDEFKDLSKFNLNKTDCYRQYTYTINNLNSAIDYSWENKLAIAIYPIELNFIAVDKDKNSFVKFKNTYIVEANDFKDKNDYNKSIKQNII